MRGSIFKRGETWTAVYDEPRTDGKRKQRWLSGFRTRKEAERKLGEVLGQLGGGGYVEPARLTVADFLEREWLPGVRGSLRPGTWQSYARTLRTRVIPRLGAVPLQRLSAPQLNALYDELGRSGSARGGGLAPRSVAYTHAVIRKALGDATRWGRVQRNVATLAEPPRASGHKPMRTWNPDELRRFLEHVADDQLFALWRLFVATGLRRGEALGLGWDAVDLDAARLSVRRALVVINYRLEWSEPKTRRSRRVIPLDVGTVAALREHRKRQLEGRLAWGAAYEDQGLVFARENGTPLHPETVSAQFTRHAAAAGLDPIRLHDLRHSYASAALAAGVHVKVVSEQLGHATVALTLDTYSHVIPALGEDAAERVAALLD